MSPIVCEEGADALIDACRERSPNGTYRRRRHARRPEGLPRRLEKRPCAEVCGKAAPLPTECERFAPGLAPVEVQCGAPGKLFDEENAEGGVE